MDCSGLTDGNRLSKTLRYSSTYKNRYSVTTESHFQFQTKPEVNLLDSAERETMQKMVIYQQLIDSKT